MAEKKPALGEMGNSGVFARLTNTLDRRLLPMPQKQKGRPAFWEVNVYKDGHDADRPETLVLKVHGARGIQLGDPFRRTIFRAIQTTHSCQEGDINYTVEPAQNAFIYRYTNALGSQDPLATERSQDGFSVAAYKLPQYHHDDVHNAVKKH